jgi:hypothetical protein
MEGLYRGYITPSARKETKKLTKRPRAAALDATKRLESDPFVGDRLTGLW